MTAVMGLRERKKRAAIRHIQQVALDLFDAHGYEAVTVEQVAAAADVSPSSIYRYFGTKEELVLYDELDLQLFDVIERELVDHPPLEAVRRAVARLVEEAMSRDEALAVRKTRYAMSEPALRAAQLAHNDAFVRQAAEGLARAQGRDPGELEIMVTAAALVWSLAAAVRHWHVGGYRTSLREELDAALATLERGLGA